MITDDEIPSKGKRFSYKVSCIYVDFVVPQSFYVKIFCLNRLRILFEKGNFICSLQKWIFMTFYRMRRIWIFYENVTLPKVKILYFEHAQFSRSVISMRKLQSSTRKHYLSLQAYNKSTGGKCCYLWDGAREHTSDSLIAKYLIGQQLIIKFLMQYCPSGEIRLSSVSSTAITLINSVFRGLKSYTEILYMVYYWCLCPVGSIFFIYTKLVTKSKHEVQVLLQVSFLNYPHFTLN